MSQENSVVSENVEGVESEAKAVRTDGLLFVGVWNSSPSATIAAEKLGITVASASARATKFRKLGIELKDMPKGGGRKLDIAALKAAALAALEAAK